MNFYNGEPHSEKYGDKQFISEQIDLLPIALQAEISDRYSEIYKSLVIDDPQKARQRANNWLRLTVNKHKAIDRTNLPF